MKIGLTIFLFLITFLTYGQYDWTKGELVLTNGDTLRGQIKLPKLSKNITAIYGKEKVKYRKNRKSKKKKYDESQVITVIFRNSESEIAFYEYLQISEKKKSLFKVIISGKVNLYARSISVANAAPMNILDSNIGAYNYSNPWSYCFNNFNEFYVLRENEQIAAPLITVGISRSFKKRAMSYFEDCSAVVSKLYEEIYIKDDVRDVVQEYNQCK